ncbi:MAG: prolyl oligopeptidase family serine peptidase [Salibacteraceae bacterium]
MIKTKKSISLLGVALLFSGYVLQAQKQKMNPELLWELGRVSGETLSPDGESLYYGVTRYNTDDNKGNRDLFMMPTSGGESTQITAMPGSEYGIQFRPDGKKLGFMNGGQWWEANFDGTDAKKITDFAGGIGALKYSPDGTKVAFIADVKMDKSLNESYPNLPKAEARIIDDLMYRHWDHWEDGARSHVFVADYKNGQVLNPIDIMEGEPYDCPLQPFGGSEDFVWHPSSNIIAYVCKKEVGVKAAQSTNSDIYFYNIETGKTTNQTAKHLGYDMSPSFSTDGKTMAWLSMATPGYESDKQVLITKTIESDVEVIFGNSWDNTISNYSWNNDNSKFIIGAGVDATYQIFEVKIGSKTKEITQLTQGQHNIGGVIGEYKGKYIAPKTDMNHAAELYSFDKKGKANQLTTINDSIYANVEMSRVEKRWMTTTDGKKMLTWVIYPPNFDSNKKYPSLLYCQGGPQSAVSQFYSFRWNFQLMAADDYIIIAPNRRGLPTFGEKWNADISKDWGGQPMDDYLTAVNEMKKESFIDSERIGAIGASYGGYSVYMLAGIHNNTFCSFISHCGLFNLESWYGVTEELFFANYDIGGPYWTNPQPESYAKFSPHKKVGNWNTPIMVIHGGNDFRVPINQGQEAFQAAKIKGLKTRFLYFPNEGHWVLKPQNGLLWHSEFFKWLDETVKNK